MPVNPPGSEVEAAPTQACLRARTSPAAPAVSACSLLTASNGQRSCCAHRPWAQMQLSLQHIRRQQREAGLVASQTSLGIRSLLASWVQRAGRMLRGVCAACVIRMVPTKHGLLVHQRHGPCMLWCTDMLTTLIIVLLWSSPGRLTVIR